MRQVNEKVSMGDENRVEYLENKIENILATIDFINNGDIEEATKSLNSYKKTSAHIVLSNLINTVEDLNVPKGKVNDKSYIFLRLILNSIPFPVFIKDQNSRYLLVNALEEELFGSKESEILGKHDRDFVHNEEELKIIQESDDQVLLENKSIELPNQNFSLKNGKSFVFKTHKMPFINPLTGKCNILGYSLDITDSVNFDKLRKILVMSGPYL